MNFELIERAIRLAHKPQDVKDFDSESYVEEASSMIKELYEQMFTDDRRHTEEVAKWINNCNTLMEKLDENK